MLDTLSFFAIFFVSFGRLFLLFEDKKFWLQIAIDVIAIFMFHEKIGFAVDILDFVVLSHLPIFVDDIVLCPCDKVLFACSIRKGHDTLSIVQNNQSFIHI